MQLPFDWFHCVQNPRKLVDHLKERRKKKHIRVKWINIQGRFLPSADLKVLNNGDLSCGDHRHTKPSAPQESSWFFCGWILRPHTASLWPSNVPKSTLGSANKFTFISMSYQWHLLSDIGFNCQTVLQKNYEFATRSALDLLTEQTPRWNFQDTQQVADYSKIPFL
jgi:hypothetical protein